MIEQAIQPQQPEPKVKVKISKAATSGGNIGWDITVADGATKEEAMRVWELAMRVHRATETAFMPVISLSVPEE